MTILQLYKSKKSGKFVAGGGNITDACGLHYIQTVPSNIWEIPLDSSNSVITIQVFVNNVLIIPDDITTTPTHVTVYFDSHVIGFVNIIVNPNGQPCPTV